MELSNEAIRITKTFSFEMAHALYNYNGACRNIHGHSYKLHVTLMGYPLRSTHHAEDGMVMDFGKLKSVVIENVINDFDHALILNVNMPDSLLDEVKRNFEKVKFVAFQPTCENLLIAIKNVLEGSLGKKIIYSVKLFETESSWCEWKRSDNPL
jgi:6-pyruvoyltetrahydropterin/6-carboxytetrahydropterin synthase